MHNDLCNSHCCIQVLNKVDTYLLTQQPLHQNASIIAHFNRNPSQELQCSKKHGHLQQIYIPAVQLKGEGVAVCSVP